MLLVISQFRVANGMEEAVRDAFLNRPHQVDDAAGFLGMEVFTDEADPTFFSLVTRWADAHSYDTWHASPEHRSSHQFIPKGLKLDPACTKLMRLERIEAPGPPPLEEQMLDLSPLLARLISSSDVVHYLVASHNGTMRTVNPAFLRSLGYTDGDGGGHSLWAYLTSGSIEHLQGLLRSSERQTQVRHRLHFVDAQQHPFTLDCLVDIQPDQIILLGEAPASVEAKTHEEMLKLANDWALTSRDTIRQQRERLQHSMLGDPRARERGGDV